MKQLFALISTVTIAVSCAFAQTVPVVQTPPARPRFQLTPEQVAAQKVQAAATDADHQNMMDQLHITSLRRGRDGNDSTSGLLR